MKKSNKLLIQIITLFPKFIEDFVENFGIVKRAIKLKLLEIKPVNLRSFGFTKRQIVDDRPYGGGVGMVLRADVLLKAIQSAWKFQMSNSKLQIKFPSDFATTKSLRAGKIKNPKSRIILLTPQGKKFNQADAQRLGKYRNLILICGRYEGFDERIRQFVDEEISMGDYVLMGGELPALVLTEAIMRLRPGILGKDESSVGESFANNLLEYPQYTKPEVLEIRDKRLGKRIKHLQVPKVLLTGHHKNINEWREKEATIRTKKRRPDLLKIDQD